MSGGRDIGAETLRRMRTVSRYNDWILVRIRPWLGNRVLETGAGTGTFSRFFLDREQLVLTDIREDYLATLRESAARGRERLDKYTLQLQQHGLDQVEREVRWLGELIDQESANTSTNTNSGTDRE